MATLAALKGNPTAAFTREKDNAERPILLFIWTLAYAIATWMTRAYFMADTVDYVSGVTLRDRGIDYVFWDFRHLLWRPLGWLFLHILSPVLSASARQEPRIVVLYIFIALNWTCGLLSIFVLRALLRRFSIRSWAIEWCTAAFVVAFAFLNYVHAGTPYIPGLMFSVLGYYLAARSAEPNTSSYWKYAAAASLAFSVCLWFPYSFAVPGALAVPLFYPNPGIQRLKLVLSTTATCVLLGILAYGSVLTGLHLYTVPAIMHWVGQGANSVAGVRGLDRTVFGLTHSFIDMGRDGTLFKRYLLHDPYNPVSARELIRLSIWKLVLFYSVLGAIVLTLIRSTRGRNILAFCAVAAGPVLIFALLWFGGDIERYLPLYPAFFVALGSAIETDHSKLIRFLAGTFLILSLISNFFALSSRRLAAQEQAAVDRIAPLLPLLRPSSRVVVVDIHDDLVNFSRSYPFNPINRNAELLNYPLLNPGTPQTKHWREAFAASVAATWNSQADVWISKRLLSPRPMGEWGWIEHGDPNLRWKEVNAFFSQLDYGQDVDGADGFLLLPKTQKNVAVLAPLQTTQ